MHFIYLTPRAAFTRTRSKVSDRITIFIRSSEMEKLDSSVKNPMGQQRGTRQRIHLTWLVVQEFIASYIARPCVLSQLVPSYSQNIKPVSGADEQELATPILSLCPGIFTDWSIFSTPFFFSERKAVPVQSRSDVNNDLVSCDWLSFFYSHGSLIQSRFDLKINQSLKTPW